MEPTKLGFLADDHLAPIFALLDGEDTTKLYFSGDKRLIQHLIRSVTALHFNLGYYETFSFPPILFRFPRLNSLSIVVKGSRSYLRVHSSSISQLPPSLTHLEIDRSLSCQPPDYDNPAPDHIVLSSYLPHLKSFIWRNPMSLPMLQAPTFATTFTPNLLHLDLYRICLSCTDLSRLPQTLLTLKILVESVDSGDQEVHFPPQLASLSVCRLSYSMGHLCDHLPETLTSLECAHGSLTTATLEKLPRELKNLSFNADDLAVPLLPPTLTSFRSTSLMCLSSRLYHLLPRSIIHFDDQGLISRRYNWDALAEHLPMLPPNLIRIPRFLMYCPPYLWKLLPRTAECACNVNFEIECSAILKNYTLLTTHLPPRLHSVALHDANELCIKMMPISITKISILSKEDKNTMLDPTWLNHLTALAHLDFGFIDVAFRQFAKFEPKLKSISIRNRFSMEDLDFKAPWLLSIESADLDIAFPRPLPSILHQFATSMPILQSLRILSPFRTDRFHALPRTVTSLTIDQLEVVGSLGIAMTQLPPKVKQIKLQRVAIHETEAADLLISESVANAIPKSITDLQIAWEPISKAKWESAHSMLVKDALEPLCRRKTIFTLVVDRNRT